MKDYLGRNIDGRYELTKKLGSGGMSSVYMAWDNHLEKYWAVKCIESGNVISGLSEANVLKHLDHPCLPRVVDVLSDNDTVYLVMDYVEGETLGEILREKGVIDEKRVYEWTIDILRGLSYLHDQSPPIIYRDMKPDNVMLSRNGQIKIIDFGIARTKKNEDKISTTQSEDTVLLGTRGYAAPEQFGGKGQSDERTDIYCLGATMYHLLTGKSPCEPPYHMYPIRHFDSTLSKGMENILIKATKADPDKRYQSCQEFIQALLHIDDEEDVRQQRMIILGRLNKAMIILGAILILAFILSGIVQSNLITKSYEQLLLQSDRAVVYEDRLKVITSAIDLVPKERKGYDYLIQLIKEDGVFDQAEEVALLRIWERDSKSLAEGEYREVAYEIGILYWYYYSYGKEDLFGVKQSITWFQESIVNGEDKEYVSKANCYYLLALFHRDITSKVTEGNDEGMYMEYFGNLERLVMMTNQVENSKIIMESRQQVLVAIDSYYQNFVDDGVDVRRIEELIRRCQEDLEDYGVDEFN